MIFLDGGFGTMMQAAGLPTGKDPCEWNLENPEAVIAAHRAYVEAGSDIVLANTFGANPLKYHGAYGLKQIIAAAVDNARKSGAKKVALDLGPTGRLIRNAGDLEFDEAVDCYAEAVRYGTESGADLLFIETIGDTRELKAAVIAAKENSKLPVYCTVALGENGKLLTGGSVESVSVLLEGLGVDAYGFNCGLGPDRMLPYVERLAKVSTRPIIVEPNAGMPMLEGGRTVFKVGPAEFADHVAALMRAGASIVGGCCGTTPNHIAAVVKRLQGSVPTATAIAPRTVVSSGVETVELKSHDGLVIGERINPTGKKRLKEAYRNGDVAYVLREAVTQTEAGARILDINCGVPGIDEKSTLERTVVAVEGVVTCPLQIDTADPVALEAALRRVDGKCLVNSVNGKREVMDAVFPIVRKYGGTIVALCLDEAGIPATARERVEIAKRILTEGAKYGFRKEDFVVDALTLAVSADPSAAKTTLETVRLLTDELGVNTVLGVSNVSFGLPGRPALNNAMYTLAKRAGLSAAIANPSVIREVDDPAAEDVLLGRDINCERWIAANAEIKASVPETASADAAGTLARSIIHGLKDDAAAAAAAMLAAGTDPMEVVKAGIVPSLEQVGSLFEKGSVFLPQLLMSADAAGAAFESVKRTLSAKGGSKSGGRPIVLATVKGDIHDIGKNIVRALLENYGFEVIDLGRDVPPERIVEAAQRSDAFLVGLSALMTTTVGAMAETIALLKKAGLGCKTCVGGAVVTEEYAKSIGADYYAKDAMRTVRIASAIRS